MDGSSTTDLQDNQLLSSNSASGNGTGSSTTAASGTVTTTSTILTQTLTVSGPLGKVDDIIVPNGASAFDVAALVSNREGETSVTADATNSATISDITASGTVSFDLYSSNGNATKTITAQVLTTDLSALVSEINKQSGSTGVSAELSVDRASAILTQSDGKDIVVQNFSHSNSSATMDVTGTDGAAEPLSIGQGTRTTGTILFHSSGTYSASSSVADSAGSIFDVGADTQVGSIAIKLSTVDISSPNGSQEAIAIIDSSLDQINSMRAALGAIQNRMESTITNLAIQGENISAARSRIMDADFAAETAKLARNQILQQAGTAMLAQANQLPQGVLALLQG